MPYVRTGGRLRQRDPVGEAEEGLYPGDYARYAMFQIERSVLQNLGEDPILQTILQDSIIGSTSSTIRGQKMEHDLVVVTAEQARNILHALLKNAATYTDLRLCDIKTSDDAVSMREAAILRFEQILGFESKKVSVENHFRLVAIDLSSYDRLIGQTPELAEHLVTRDEKNNAVILLMGRDELFSLLNKDIKRSEIILRDRQNEEIIFPDADRATALDKARQVIPNIKLGR